MLFSFRDYSLGSSFVLPQFIVMLNVYKEGFKITVGFQQNIIMIANSLYYFVIIT